MKLLFTDLDGTLLNQRSEVSPAMREALFRMAARGHRLVLTSGRPLAAILEVQKQAGLTLPGLLIIANNGALIYDCGSKTVLQEMRLAPKDVSLLFELAHRSGLHLHTYLDNAILTDRQDPETAFYRRCVHMPVQELAGARVEEVLTEGPFKCLAIHLTDRNRLEAFRSEAKALVGERITSLFSNNCYLEFFDKRAGKGNAVRFVCHALGVPLSDTFAAGDAENDLSMLQAAGTGIAMQNASETVKKAAAIVTSRDNDHDGLIEILTLCFP